MRSLFLMDDQAALLNRKEKILYGLVVLFIVTFYMPHMPVVNNIAVALISLFWFFYNSFRDKLNLAKQRKEVILMVLFYLQHIISTIFSHNRQEGISWTTIRLPLLVFPVTIGLMYIRGEVKERLLYAYALITSLTVAICIGWAITRSIRYDDNSLLYNDNLTDLIDKQSVYVALMVNLAIFCFGYLLSIRSKLVSTKWVTYSALLILLIGNFCMASRINITILYSSIFCIAVWYAIKKKKFTPLIVVVVTIGIAWVLLISFFPKTLNRFRELNYTSYDYRHHGVESHFNMDVTSDQWNGANIRLAVWSCGWELVKQHPLLGVQIGDKVDRMMEVYAEKKFDFAYSSHRNMHNNYLDILVAFGLVGFLLFLFGFLLLPLIKCIRTKDVFGVFVILAFMCTFLPETYFDRSMGNMIFAFFIGLIISYRKPVSLQPVQV
jgi:O-antigen ligase